MTVYAYYCHEDKLTFITWVTVSSLEMVGFHMISQIVLLLAMMITNGAVISKVRRISPYVLEQFLWILAFECLDLSMFLFSFCY